MVDDAIRSNGDHGPHEHRAEAARPAMSEQLPKLGLSERRAFFDSSRYCRRKPVAALP